MLYLYEKLHNITGLRYLGYTSKDPFKYKGSGLYWKRHLAVYGNSVTTTILKVCVDKNEIKHWGEYYSTLWNIVNSAEWANLKPESADGGSAKGIHVGFRHSNETKKIISVKKKGKPNPAASWPRTDEQKSNLSVKLTGKKRTEESKEKSRISKKNNPYRHTEEVKNKLKIAKSEDTKDKMKSSQQLRRKNNIKDIWITDGVDNLLVKENIKICDGWRKGRTLNVQPPSQKGKFWITNGNESKMVTEMLPGFVRGRK